MTSHRTYAAVLASFLFLLPPLTHAATLTISPAAVSVSVGDSVTETVFVSSTNQALNAVSGSLSFPHDLLEVVSVSRANSVLSLWVQEPSFSNLLGSITWSGIVPNPGYIGGPATLLSIQFRAKAAGTAPIVFSSSAVLANDGNGTNILTATQPSTLTVGPSSARPGVSSFQQPSVQTGNFAHITSSSRPDGTYRLSHVTFDWTNPPGTIAVRLGLDTNPDGKPNVVYTDPISHKELDVENGTWYFHVQQRGPNGWGPVSTYTLVADSGPPLPAFAGWMQSSPLLSYGWLAANYLSLALIALTVLGALLFAAWYLFIRFTAYRYGLKDRLGITYAHIHKEFRHFKHIVLEEIAALEQAKLKRALTQDEARLIARFKKLLELSGHNKSKGPLTRKEKEMLAHLKKELDQSEKEITADIQ